MNEARNIIERYNVGLASADEAERDIDHMNMASDSHTYAIAYDAHGHAVLIKDGRRVV